ncbi:MULTISPECIES: hypothetical protein [unclassified Nostoc]|nr:hypothetical protein [Nostoc sp. KVJ20]
MNKKWVNLIKVNSLGVARRRHRQIAEIAPELFGSTTVTSTQMAITS